MRDKHTERLTRRALYLAAAMILSYIESLFPPPVAVPGIKWGWANLAAVMLLAEDDRWGALAVSLIRTVLSGLLFSGAQSLMYSVPAALAAWAVMVLAGKFLAVIPVSALGALAHNMVQGAVAIAVARTPGIAYFLPWLAAAALLTGTVNGGIACLMERILPRKGKNNNTEEQRNE